MIKLRKKHTISLISIALCFVFLSGGIQNVMGASYEAWPDDPNEPHVWSWKSPEGYLYLARYRLDMNTAEGTKSNEPIMITPWFPDNYATLDSCRIVYENNTGTANEYVEIPYFPESSVNYSSGCLKTATIKFVAPELSGIYYLLFSNNETFQPPSYSMEKIPTIENNILNNVFYDGKYKDSHNIRFNSAGNKTISFLVPKSSEVDDVNITEARFNYSASPIFKETSNIQLDNRYNGMGPASVKFINGTAWNNYTNPYLLIGGPNNAYIYQYQKDNQDFYNIATIDSGSPGNLVSGLTAGNIIGADGSDLELVFGKKDGDVEIYNFDGNWDSSPTLGYTTYVNGTEKFKKPYGLSVLNVINASFSELGGVIQTPKTDLVMMADPLSSESENYIQTLYEDQPSGPFFRFPVEQNAINIGDYPDNTNWSYQILSYLEHDPNQRENFFEQKYQARINDVNEYDMEEFLSSFVSTNFDQSLRIGIYEARNFISDVENKTEIFKRLRATSSADYDTLVEKTTGAAGIGMSRDITPFNDIFILGAGMDKETSDLTFNWKNFSVEESSGAYSYENRESGYMSFAEAFETVIDADDLAYNPENVDTRLTVTTGNFDHKYPDYDDALFVDNYGQYYMFCYNPSIKNIELKNYGSLLGDNSIDLFGTGQSIDAFDIDYDGDDEIAIGDDNGYVHFVNFTFGKNLKVWSKMGTGPDKYNKSYSYESNFDFDDVGISREVTGLESEFNMDLGNQTFNGAVGDYSEYGYWNVSMNIEVEAPCMIELSDFYLNYQTNNLSLVELNRNLDSKFKIDLTSAYSFIQYLDYDQDGLYDFWEAQDILVWNPSFFTSWNEGAEVPTSTNPVVNIDNFLTEELDYNESVAPTFSLDPFNNDTDDDGILDGVEILIHGTNPNSNDTDLDDLNDWDELFLHSSNPKNNDTDGDLLRDNQEVLSGCDPTIKNTDGDGVIIQSETMGPTFVELDDYQEVIEWNTNPSDLDTDGDGLSDLEELGIWENRSQFLSIYLNSIQNQGSDIVFAHTDEYIEQYYPSLLPYLFEGSTETGLCLDPTKADSDGDGLSDYQELKEPFEYQGKDFYSHPGLSDTDQDGLNDLEEREYSYSYYTYEQNNEGEFERVFKSTTQPLNPDNKDTDSDEINDGVEQIYQTSPLNNDTDGDGLLDGVEVYGFELPNEEVVIMNATNRDSDGDGLLDGSECNGYYLEIDGTKVNYWFFGMDEEIQLFSYPNMTDSDGDGLSDYEEIRGREIDGKRFGPTDPTNPDTDDDGKDDSEDPHPVLKESVYQTFIGLSIAAGVGAVVMAGVNKYSAEKIVGRRMKYESTLDKAADRMERERDERGHFQVTASTIPTEDPESFKVKLTMEIIDKSFFGLACRINYSAGAQEFKKVKAKEVKDDLYEFALEDIPVDTRVLYSVEFLDRGGEWVKDDNDGKFYTFATNADGTIDTHHTDEWQIDRSFKCEVCGYTCLPEWDECPNCGSPLHESLEGEVLLDEKEKKKAIQKREKDKEAIAWAEAQKTDEVWRGLPDCPECGMSVQPEWAECPVCGADLTQFNLEKSAVYRSVEIDMDYIEGKEEEKIETEYEDDTPDMKSEKELLDEKEEEERKKKEEAWKVDTDENVDIL